MTKEQPHSLHMVGVMPRLVPVNYPMLVTRERFSSASVEVEDFKTTKRFFLTPLETIPHGEHTVSKWRFSIVGGVVRKVWEIEGEKDG